MMPKLGTCVKCGAEIEKETWVTKFGFCTPQHYIEYMNEHRLWSEGDRNYSQEHMEKILERTIQAPVEWREWIDIPEGKYTFADIDRLSWLDAFIGAECALVVADILYVLLA